MNFTGAKVGFTFTPGHPAVRIHMAKRFTEESGFEMLLEVFRQPKFTWPGGDVLHIFLKLLNIGEVGTFFTLIPLHSTILCGYINAAYNCGVCRS